MKYCSGQIKYLAAIRELSAENEEIKSVSIAKHLGVSRASVSKTLRCLANSGLVYDDFCNSIVLTPEGEKVVNELFRNFGEVYAFFHKFLKLPQEQAHEQALTFITTFPDDTCERLKRIVRKTMRKNNA